MKGAPAHAAFAFPPAAEDPRPCAQHRSARPLPAAAGGAVPPRPGRPGSGRDPPMAGLCADALAPSRPAGRGAGAGGGALQGRERALRAGLLQGTGGILCSAPAALRQARAEHGRYPRRPRPRAGRRDHRHHRDRRQPWPRDRLGGAPGGLPLPGLHPCQGLGPARPGDRGSRRRGGAHRRPLRRLGAHLRPGLGRERLVRGLRHLP